MKKRNIIIISVSTISLIFGGLVFLGVSTFPELLEEKNATHEKGRVEQSFIDTHFAKENEGEKKDEIVVASYASDKSNTYVYDNESSRHTGKHATVKDTSIKEVETNYVEVSSVKNDKTFLHETYVEVASKPTHTRNHDVIAIGATDEKEQITTFLIKDNKQAALEITQANNSAIMNTTIMAIGLCELLSFILVMKRKRHLLR